jgi:hypothetical protein
VGNFKMKINYRFSLTKAKEKKPPSARSKRESALPPSDEGGGETAGFDGRRESHQRGKREKPKR